VHGPHAEGALLGAGDRWNHECGKAGEGVFVEGDEQGAVVDGGGEEAGEFLDDGQEGTGVGGALGLGGDGFYEEGEVGVDDRGEVAGVVFVVGGENDREGGGGAGLQGEAGGAERVYEGGDGCAAEFLGE
jgi:hypothetical protein